MNEARIRAVEKLYDRIANGEELSDKEYEFIKSYEVQCIIDEKNKIKNNKGNSIDTIFKYGKKAVDMIDKVFPNEPKS